MYSQYGEDEKIFKYINKKDEGLYIDIGAGQPDNISNTYMLYQMGWKGLLIEPSPILTPKLKEKRPKDIIYEGAILDYVGTVKLFSKEMYGITSRSYIYHSHIAKAKKDGFKEQYWEVSCTTLAELLKLYPQFNETDFISIDVDGNEDVVLASVNFETFKPKLLLIEYILRGQDQRHRWEHFLSPYYDLVDSETSNAFYRRKV
jgi:FkbM family methyltransferase